MYKCTYISVKMFTCVYVYSLTYVRMHTCSQTSVYACICMCLYASWPYFQPLHHHKHIRYLKLVSPRHHALVTSPLMFILGPVTDIYACTFVDTHTLV